MKKALLKALKKGWIKGAALHVYEKEPLPEDSTLLKFDNLVLTPHIGSATTETRNRMAEIAAENLIAVISGTIPQYLANVDVVRMRPLG